MQKRTFFDVMRNLKIAATVRFWNIHCLGSRNIHVAHVMKQNRRRKYPTHKGFTNMQKTIIFFAVSLFFLSCEDYDFKSINHPPNAPSNPSPANGATGLSTAPTLSWTCSDPDNDGLTYDVYFGTSSNPTTAIATGQTAASIARSGLSNNTTYYWKIVSRDNNGNTKEGSIWSFATAAIPNSLTITSPNGGENWTVGSSQNITWSSTGTIANVKLEYSTNSGSSWITIVTSTPNDGTEALTVPNTPYATCRVRVTDVTNSAVTDMSDANFTISGTVTDIDGNVYHYITIGTQTWMVENLKTTRYRNGDAIQNATDNTAWSNLTIGAYCNYDNNSSNATTYGRLYNWYAVNDSRNIAPAGWHVPTDNEWKILEMYLGMTQQQADATGWRGTDEGNKLKEAGNSHWASPSAGTNSSGFTALPGGCRYSNGTFGDVGNYGYWWSSSEYDATLAWLRGMYYDNAYVSRSNYVKKVGFSIRCVRD